MPDDNAESMLKRHKAERKARRKANNAILSGKKGDARAAAERDIAAANEALAARHAGEKAAREESQSNDTADDTGANAQKKGKKSKALRRKEKKARDAKAREAAIAAENAAAGPTDKEVEMALIEAKLATLSLAVKPVAADGHCLYRAVLDQLGATGHARAGDYPAGEAGVVKLRGDVARFMRARAGTFVPFLALAEGDTFERYCARVADTADWGGQPELLALAQLLRTPIEVHKADAPVLLMGEDEGGGSGGGGGGGDGVLRVSFHTRYYALGEHFNSVVRRNRN